MPSRWHFWEEVPMGCAISSYFLFFFQGFLHCDDSMRQEESLKDEMSGSTAITVLIK